MKKATLLAALVGLMVGPSLYAAPNEKIDPAIPSIDVIEGQFLLAAAGKCRKGHDGKSCAKSKARKGKRLRKATKVKRAAKSKRAQKSKKKAINGSKAKKLGACDKASNIHKCNCHWDKKLKDGVAQWVCTEPKI